MTKRESPKNQFYSYWHSYQLKDRHAPWKVFLPISKKKPILVLGLFGSDLASLGRSWELVHVYKSEESDIKWANKQADSLGHLYCFKRIHDLRASKVLYSSIVINADVTNLSDVRVALELLDPGGCIIWIGYRRSIPSSSFLHNNGCDDIKKYIFLPPNADKILLPISDYRSTREGLILHTPGKFVNRIAARIAYFTPFLSWQNILNTKFVVVAKKPGKLNNDKYLLRFLGKHVGCPIADATVYCGWRNLTLQLLNNDKSVIAIAKVSDTYLGDMVVNNETETLNQLENESVKNQIPKILYTGIWHGHYIQVQQAFKKKQYKYVNKLTSSHMKFLTSLSYINRCEMRLVDWPQWTEIINWANNINFFSSSKEYETIHSAVDYCSQKFQGKKLIFHRIHGDFVPWHFIYSNNGLKVIDWQDSEPNGLPLYDLVHFLLRGNPNGNHKLIEKFLNNPISLLKFVPGVNSIVENIYPIEDLTRLALIAFAEYKIKISGGIEENL